MIEHDRAGCAARLDRRTGVPAIGRGVVDVDVAEIRRTATPTNRPYRVLEYDAGRTAFRAWQRRPLYPCVRGGVVDGVVGDRRAVVAAAEDVNPARAHDRGVTTARRGQRRGVAPLLRTRVVYTHPISRHVADAAETPDQVDTRADHRRGWCVEPLRQRRLLRPLRTVEAFDLQHRPRAGTGTRKRIDRI